MTESGESVVRCAWCLKRIARSEDVCPHCRRPVETADLKPLGGRTEPVPGAGTEGEAGGELTPLGGGAEGRAPSMSGEEDIRRFRAGAVAPRGRRERVPPGRLDLRYQVEPLEPAPGQEPETSWKYIKAVARADKLFTAVLAFLALQVLLAFLRVDILGLILSALILSGVLSFRWWGYWLALIGALLGLLVSLSYIGLGMVSAIQSGTVGLGLILFTVSAAVNLFIALVLFTRRQHFG